MARNGDGANVPAIDRFDSRRSTAYANRGMVATSQPLAAEAGAAILRDGGNAFDAAVAAAAALNVVEPTSTGLGGDAFALYRTADGELGGMQSCGPAPAAASIEAVRAAVAAETGADPTDVTMPRRGPHAVTVPGTARGWAATIVRHGRLDLETVLEPAIEYALEGYPVSPVVAAQWAGADELFDDAHAREAYLPNGREPTAGETVRLPGLGASLRTVAERGADVVYEGDIGEAIVAEVQSHGGLLTMDDLAAFEPSFVDPISAEYGGATVYELPPPNQGLLALEALSIAEELGARDRPAGSAARLHAAAEATKVAFRDGHHYVTDPAYEPVPDLADRAYARDRAAEIGDRATDTPRIGTPPAAEFSDTVLVCAGDGAGNLVSFINSRFEGFGSGLVAGDTGIALQNRGASFSLDPDHPNSLAGGKRPFHTLIPGVVRFGPEDWAAFGVMGGAMQPQGHVQVLSAVIDDGASLQAALDRPRWRYLYSGALAVEARFDDGVLSELARRGHDLRVLPPERFGGAQIVRRRDGTLSGATEPRKDGQVAGF